MKRKLFFRMLVMAIMLLALCCVGCGDEDWEDHNSSGTEEGNPEADGDTSTVLRSSGDSEDVEQTGNSLFTDDFFEDVVLIYTTRGDVVTGDQVKPVIEFLKGLSLTETDDHLSTTTEDGELLYGGTAITFRKSNGYDITFLVDGYGKLTCVSYTSYAETFSYIADVSVSDDESFLGMLGEAFDQGMEMDETES
ncbi:MAG: hypothetical protein LUE29_05280 [Lachnospiraceae bacterium]|nr:hypothetical protein [Lachnospiraceae bacterium]